MLEEEGIGIVDASGSSVRLVAVYGEADLHIGLASTLTSPGAPNASGASCSPKMLVRT